MATYSSAKLFPCFFFAVMVFAEGAKAARVVYPRLLEERSSDGGMVVKVHDDLTLNLRKGSVAARQLRVLTEENGRPVTQFYNGEDIEKHLYEDEEQSASVMVTKAGSGVRMEGLVSPIHRIQPMAVSARSEDGVVPHEIHEIEQKEMLDKTLTYRLKDTVPSERSWNSGSTNVPPSVTVEVFVVLDRWHHRHFNSTEHALWYLCVTVNAANLRYSDTSNPRIRLLLTGVEKAVKEEYVVTEKIGYLFDDGTLTKFRAHAVLQKTTYGQPDVVYLMTGRDVSTYQNGKVTDAGLGIGFMSGVCTEFYVALGEDKPGLFTGMHTFSHEMAHLLGAKHDGDGPDLRIPGHPGARSCPWDLGHIMSYRNTGPAHHRFSTCSLDQMRLVISRAGPACWKVTAEGESVRNTFPGMVVSFKEFCSVLPSNKNFTYDHATVYQANCKVRCYFYSLMEHPVFPEWGSYKVTYDYTADALDYMQCGNHHVCIRAICQDRKGFPSNTTKIADTSEPATVTETTTYDETSTTKRTTRATRRMFAWRHRTRKGYP